YLLLLIRRPPPASLFPYTTLFRSSRADVTIRSGADVNGDVTSAGAVFNQHPEDVSGTITEGATIPENGQVSWPQPLPSDADNPRSEEHTSELQSRENLVCRLLLEK